MIDIQDRIIKIATDHGLSQLEFAKELNINRHTITAIFNKRQKPTIDLCELIVKKYHINPAWILVGEGEMYQKDKYIKYIKLDNKGYEMVSEKNGDYIKKIRDELLEAQKKIEFLKLFIKESLQMIIDKLEKN